MKYSSFLNDWCKFLNNTYKTNNGGCCYVAYLIAKNLEKLSIPYSLVLLDCFMDDEEDPDNVKENILNHNLNTYATGDSTVNHYVIKVQDEYFNNYGFENHNELVITGVKAKDILWLYKTGHWNKMYDKQNNPLIKKTINLFFNNYFNV